MTHTQNLQDCKVSSVIVHRGLTGGLVRLCEFEYNCPVSSFFPSVSVRASGAGPINPDCHNDIILNAMLGYGL